MSCSYQCVFFNKKIFLLFRSFISSWRDHHHPHPHELVVHHDYSPFRFSDSHHHHYDPTAAYYTDAAMDSYASSSAAASVYSPYMVHHHHSPSPTNLNSPTIRPETAAAAALQSALTRAAPMSVNVSMNFNSHNVQYTTGYNVPSATVSSTSNLPYDPFYGSTRHSVPSTAYHHHHHPSIPLEMKPRPDPMTSKQSMLLSAATNYDYKDLSKLCEFFPTPSSSAEKRKYDDNYQIST